jgi:transcription termination factor Rho
LLGCHHERRTHWQRIFLARNFPPSGIFSNEELSGEESFGQIILQRRIFHPNKKITVAQNFSVKNHPNEELSCEELSGEEFS